MDFITKILEKLKIKEIVSILLFSTLILTILPQYMLDFLGLTEIKDKYQIQISLCLISCLSYYVYKLFKLVLYFICSCIFSDSKIAIKYLKKYISYDEISLIIETFYDDSNKSFKTTGYIDYCDGRKTALESKSIIYRSSQISSFGTEFAYNLQPYARNFFNENLRNGSLEIRNNNFKYKLR